MNTTTASSITRAASTQTYYTIRFLADSPRTEDAFRAYGYFRWVDDVLDSESGSPPERIAFLRRQQLLLDQCCRGVTPRNLSLQEQMLSELVQGQQKTTSGLQLYLHNMMKVMEFDTLRRGRLVSQGQLDDYTRWLSTAVTECIHYFVGHQAYTPHDGTRYLAVSAAHIAHMLRDTFDDARLGYYNIPREVLEANHMGPRDVESDAYRAWVKSRVRLARQYFRAGKAYFARVRSFRCRLACFAYIARFEWVLDTIEREAYLLRHQYSERKSAPAALSMGWLTLSSMFGSRLAESMRARPGRTGTPVADERRSAYGKSATLPKS